MSTETILVTLITQGSHKFYSGTMEIEMIARCCSVNPRAHDPINGFQRTLDETRAISIANYIRAGGTIPSSIILSAQQGSGLLYSSKKKSITFEVNEDAFLILDGQHRVYGFRHLLNEGVKYRVPVIIYNELSPTQEARIFIDINTLQRPVPKELLLDIKRLAERESQDEEMLDDLFTSFENEKDSYLLNKLSRFDKKSGKISKVTFYDSIKGIIKDFDITSTARLYRILNAYFNAASDVARENDFSLDSVITKAIVFKVMVTHSKAIISMIFEANAEDIDKISEYKKYLRRSLPGSFQEITGTRAYLKTVEHLDRKLLRSNVTI
jgi:DGQHR domain-containing protein